MTLATYRRKRDFRRTSEPRGKIAKPRKGRLFVIQKHAASRLHYDFRLELGGVLKSWAVPKGPSLDPSEKRLAVEVEDHPLEYGSFEGTIPKGQYGGGSVLLWDRGTWTPAGDPREGLKRGNLKFELHGKKLTGKWVLIRMGGRASADGKKNWLLIKEREPGKRSGRIKDILAARPESVRSGRTIEDVGRPARGSKAAPRPKGRSSKLPPGLPPRGPGKRRPPKRPPRRKPPIQDPVEKPPVEEPPPRERAPVIEPPDPEGTSVAGVELRALVAATSWGGKGYTALVPPETYPSPQPPQYQVHAATPILAWKVPFGPVGGHAPNGSTWGRRALDHKGGAKCSGRSRFFFS